ncbi:MAG: hypothetical protein R2939_10670, partial [Kofleriaceae bacterium]
SLRYANQVDRLIAHLRQNLIIDFQGDLSIEQVREMLAGDDSREARAVLARVVAEQSVENMLLVLADCLLEPVQQAVTDGVLREQLVTYAQS